MTIKEDGEQADILFNRFLYIGTERSAFVTGNQDKHGYYEREKLGSVIELLKKDDDLTVIKNALEVANCKDLLPRRDTLFFALAVATSSESISVSQKHELYTMVLNLCKKDADFFLFIKYFSRFKKNIPTGVIKLIRTYFLEKEPLKLMKSMSLECSYYGWSFKDLLKLSHSKTNNYAMELVLTYILYNFDKANALVCGSEDTEVAEVLAYITKVREFKTSNDPQKVAQLLTELEVSHASLLPSSLNKSLVVWEALIPKLPLNELILCLPRLYRLGYLKTTTNTHSKIIEILSDEEKIKSSNIHPVEVFIGLRTLEKGKHRDPKLVKYLEAKEAMSGAAVSVPNYKKPDFTHQEPAKCAVVISALHKVLTMSYNNLQPTGKRFMVTVDVGTKMNDPCLGNRNITCAEAAALIVLTLLRAENNVTVAVFNGSTITPVSIEKSISLVQIMKKLKEAKSDYVFWSGVFDWASSNDKPIDVFINISALPSLSLPKDMRDKEKPNEAFSNYRSKLNLPHSRLITYCLTIHNLALAETCQNSLDVCGFDRNVPKVIEAYCRNFF